MRVNNHNHNHNHEDDVERPRYRVVDKDGHHGNSGCFDDIEAASSFWRSLWESTGTGNNDANWMKDIKEVMASRVPSPSEEGWNLDPTMAAKITRKKRNFSAPGSDRLVIFWPGLLKKWIALSTG